MAKIWIASKPVEASLGDYDHTYLVYDPDGNPNSGDELVFRGGPENDLPSPNFGSIVIENWQPINNSEDKLSLGEDPFADRNYTELDLNGQTAEDVKTKLSDYATALDTGNHDALGNIITDVNYTLPILLGSGEEIPAHNSNTTIKSALADAEIEFESNTPRESGTGSRISVDRFGGHESYYTNENSTITLDTHENRSILGGAGDNTYEITPNSFDQGKIVISEDNNTGSIDKIILHDVDPNDISFLRMPNGDLQIYLPWDHSGDPSIVIEDQWDSAGVPKMNTLWVEPPGGGTPEVLPLNDPNDFPRFVPGPSPNWIPGVTTPFEQGLNPASPLVLDIDGDGIELAALDGTGGVYWDIDEDGFAESSGWITGGDGLLAIDLNSDGVINDHGELFGNQPGTSIANGFEALAEYDTNSDDFITSADTQFGDLRVWIDTNADGYSQAAELHTLSSLGITSINLSYDTVSYMISGHEIKQESSFTINGNTRDIVDAWFEYDNVNSYYAGDYTLDSRTLFLPTLRGYGILPDLHIAMSLDNSSTGNLLSLVQNFATQDAENLFDPANNTLTAIREIMHRWAGADGIDEGSRGQFCNARDLTFLEKFNGQFFTINGELVEISATSAAILQPAWDVALSEITTRMMLQTSAGNIFSTKPSYNVSTDEIDGTYVLDTDFIEDMVTAHNATGIDLIRYWYNIFDFINKTAGLSNLSGGETAALNDIIEDSDTSGLLDYNYLEDVITRTDPQIYGDANDNIFLVNETSHYSYGYDGNDTFIAGNGTGEMSGGGDNDTYILAPGFGTIYAAGSTNITEAINGGTDTIKFVDGVLPTDVRMWIGDYGYLYINLGDSNPASLLTVYAERNMTGETDLGNRIEQIIFSDNTTWNFSTGLILNDTNLDHGVGGSSNNDMIDGRGGWDNILGYGGNDTLIGGEGRDYIYGGTGNDTYVFSPGDGVELSPDYIIEELNEGIDTVLLSGSIAIDDVRMWADVNGLYISLTEAEEDVLFLDGYYDNLIGTSVIDRFESITFEEEEITWDLTNGLILTDTDNSHSIIGSSQNDVIDARGGNDTIYGYAGNDILTGGELRDYIYGGLGNDTYVFAPGFGENNAEDQIIEELNEGTDEILISGGIDLADVRMWIDAYGLHITHTGDADDIVLVEGYYDSGTGTSVSDRFERITFEEDDVTWDITQGFILNDTDDHHTNYGSGQSDKVYGNGGQDSIYGYAGADQLYGNSDNDYLYGGAGNDLLDGGTGDDSIDGEADNDTVTYANAGSAVTVSLATTTAQNTVGAGNDTITNTENLVGSAFNDTLTGDENANVIEGGAGNDTINGAGGTDTVSYASAGSGVTVNLATTTGQNTIGAGTDTISNFENLTGSAFNDTLTGNTGANIIDGAAGNDTIEGGSGNDTLIGGDGVDTVSYKNASSAVTVNLATTTSQNTVGAGTDTISGFENLAGSAFNDTLTGDANANTIEGDAGNDTIDGAGGTDTLSYANASSAVTVNLATASAQNTVGAGTDTLANFENLNGSAFNDFLTGNTQANSIDGGAGNDNITGAAGNDSLTGGSGTDTANFSGNYADYTITSFATYRTVQDNVGDNGTDTVQNDVERLQFADGSYENGVFTPTPPEAPTQNQVFLLNPVTVDTMADSAAINTGTYFAAKTISVAFETGSDITTKQVIYEQGGGLRGLNIYVENGKLYQGIWNYNAGTSWGWKELEVTISADTKYTTTLVFAATGGGTGTLTGYLDGTQFGQTSGTGHLYAHSEDVGIGWMKDQSRYHGNNEYNNGHTFTGEIEKIAHYNAALTGTTLTDLHDYMGYQWLGEPIAQDDIFTGAANANITGNLLANNGNGVDSDPNNDPLSVTAGTFSTAHGSVVISSNGNFTYTPVSNYNGYDSFTYTLLDGNGGDDTGSVNLTVGTPPPTAPTQNQVFALDPVSVNTMADSAAINTDTYYAAKTISVAFETGSDITTRQVLYEQGGGSRGLNIFIENGKLYQGIWNYSAGTSWGWKELEVTISADTKYTTTLVFAATGGGTGTITGYLNGVQTGQQTGTGHLYAHSEDVGIGWMKDQSRYHGNNEYNDGHTFTGSIDKVTHYNAALTGATLDDLHDYMAYQWLDEPVAQDDIFTGAVNTNITGNLLADNGNGVDSDPDNDPLSVTAGTFSTAHGSVAISSNGNFTYTPVSNYNGYDSFTYTLLDGNGNDDTGTANLTVGTPPPQAPTQDQVFLLNPVTVDTMADSAAINTGTYYAAKTISVSFETGADITTRQVIYEQGGGLRGLNIFIENGKLYEGVWNYNAGTSWGWKEVSIDIAAGTKYTATLVLAATGGGTGTITGYLDGTQIGQQTGTGHLYAHSEDVGIGWMKDQSRYHGENFYNNGYTFTGEIEKVAHYNAALTGTTLDDLHEYMAYDWLDPQATVILGTSANNTLQGTADNNSIFGLEGADDLYGKDGLDVLMGGDGADKFIFESATAFNDIDIIGDFTTSESDKIDISDVLDGFYTPGTDAITDFVQITTSGSDSLLKIDQDGTDNGVNFVQIAQITGVTGLTDEQALVNSGHLIVV